MQPTTAPQAPARAPRRSAPLVPGPSASRRLAIGLAVLLVALALGHLVSMWLRYGLGREYAFGLVPKLNLDNEQSVGTWAQMVLLVLGAQAAALSALVATSRFRRNWWLLAAAFALLSIDEVLALHEDMILPLRAAFDLSGVLYYGWIIPLGLAGALFLLVQLRFLVHLGRPTGLLLVVAGAVYVTGAAGLEMVESLLAEGGEKVGVRYSAVAGVQEVLESTGLALAAWALFDHLAGRLRERDEPRGTPPAVGSTRRRGVHAA